jgi:hypothetical protein
MHGSGLAVAGAIPSPTILKPLTIFPRVPSKLFLCHCKLSPLLLYLYLCNSIHALKITSINVTSVVTYLERFDLIQNLVRA